MKLNQLAAKPQLIMITLDDEDTVKEFGEPIEFYTWDRQPLETFMKLANASAQEISKLVEIVRTLILDENGKQVIQGELMLPGHILIKVISKIVDKLGK
jgi:hypothetical protein